MNAEHSFDIKGLIEAPLGKGLGSGEFHLAGREGIVDGVPLFGWLKHEHHRAGDLHFVRGEDPGGRQEHGRVHVVAAHVRDVHGLTPHLTLGPAGKGQSRVFLDEQRIDVGPQAHRVALLGIQNTDNRGFGFAKARVHLVNPVFLEFGGNVGLGFVFPVAELGRFVQMAAH